MHVPKGCLLTRGSGVSWRPGWHRVHDTSNIITTVLCN